MADMVCAVDVGSTSVKVALHDPHGRVRSRGAVRLPAATGADTAEIEPAALWSVVGQAIRACRTDTADPPTVLALTTQMAGQVLLDAVDRPVGPLVMGIDRRHEPSDAGVRDARQIVRLRWWRTHHHDQLVAARRVGGIKEYLLWRIAGVWVTDPSTASVSGFYDPGAGSWCPPDFLADMEFPSVVPSAARVGVVGPRAAEELALPVGLPVICGLGDGPAASLASGAVGPGRLCLSLGTTTVARMIVDAGQPSSVPAATAEVFVQHLVDGWYCTGRRAEGDIDLPSFAAEVVQQWRATEIRLSGGRGSDQLAGTVAHATGVPVRSTAASDGTAGVALLAQYPDHWLEAARRVPVIAEARPGGAT